MANVALEEKVLANAVPEEKGLANVAVEEKVLANVALEEKVFKFGGSWKVSLTSAQQSAHNSTSQGALLCMGGAVRFGATQCIKPGHVMVQCTAVSFSAH